MDRVLVREDYNGTIAGLLRAGFLHYGISAVVETCIGGSFDIEVVAPLRSGYSTELSGSSKAVVVYGEDWPCISGLREDQPVITYGLSSRDTLTCSSNDDERMSVCVQREFPSLAGERIIRQERTFSVDTPKNPLEQLAAFACFLLYGI